ncbi:MAG: HigA family addiction module antitoxin [Hyphomicrobium sp.]
MSNFPARDPKRCPTHPAELLREIAFPALKLSKTAIADHLGISRQMLYDLLAEKQPVTPQMAVRLGKLLGNGPTLWLNMQAAYDIWHAKREVDVSKIPTFKPKKYKIERQPA